MSVRIQKWGNSLGVRIPKTVIEKVNLKENAEVEIGSKNGTIVIFSAKKNYSLDAPGQSPCPCQFDRQS